MAVKLNVAQRRKDVDRQGGQDKTFYTKSAFILFFVLFMGSSLAGRAKV